MDAMKGARWSGCKYGSRADGRRDGGGGVGKSRLFYEFKVVAENGLPDAGSLFGLARQGLGLPAGDRNISRLLRRRFRRRRPKRREKVIGKLIALDPSLEDTLPYLFVLLGILEGENPFARMDLQTRRRRTQEALKRIVLRESLEPSGDRRYSRTSIGSTAKARHG